MVAILSLVLALVMLSPPWAGAQAPRLADDASRRAALQHYRAGQELLSGEQFEKASIEFQKAVDKDPLLTLAHYGRGQSYMGLQRYASAIKAYQDCIDAFRDLHGLQQQNRFAIEKQRDDEIRELRDQQQRLEAQARSQPQGSGFQTRAMQNEQRIRDLERQKTSIEGPFQAPAEVLLALGSAHFRNGNREQAEIQWRASAQADSKLGQAHNNLAVIYLQTGRKKEAENEITLAEKAGFRVNPQLKEDVKKMP